jgi:hypothetical protein
LSDDNGIGVSRSEKDDGRLIDDTGEGDDGEGDEGEDDVGTGPAVVSTDAKDDPFDVVLRAMVRSLWSFLLSLSLSG